MTPQRFWSALAVALLPMALSAHEFWIEPEAYQVPSGGTMSASLRVGETFGGAAQSYLPRNFERFDTQCAGQLSKVPGRAGDRPASTPLALRRTGCGKPTSSIKRGIATLTLSGLAEIREFRGAQGFRRGCWTRIGRADCQRPNLSNVTAAMPKV